VSSVLSRRAASALTSVEETYGGGGWTLRALGESPEGRAVFELQRGELRVVAKAFVAVPAERPDGVLAELASARCRRLRAPLPLRWDRERRILLMTPAVGEPLASVAAASLAARMCRVGEALAELHGLGGEPGPAKTLADHVDELVRPGLDVLASRWAAAEPLVRAFRERAVRFDQEAEARPIVRLHRDFHLRQLFDDGDRVTVVDWDLVAAGDPAFDVAYLVAHLQSHLAEAEADRAIESLLAGYRPGRAMLERLPIYLAFNGLRRACRRLRLQDAGWRVEIDRSLARLSALMGLA
jgi:hypothetical protein